MSGPNKLGYFHTTLLVRFLSACQLVLCRIVSYLNQIKWDTAFCTLINMLYTVAKLPCTSVNTAASVSYSNRRSSSTSNYATPRHVNEIRRALSRPATWNRLMHDARATPSLVPIKRHLRACNLNRGYMWTKIILK